MKKQHTVVGLFAGCGGLDLGFINAGFSIVWANDFMKEAVELRRFDDQAKVLNKETPNLEHFKNYLEDSLKN